MKRSEFMKNVEEVDFADAVCGLMLKGYDVYSEDGLVDYAKTLLDNGDYADADTIIEALMETSYSGYYRTYFCGGTPYPINDIVDIEDLLEED